MNLLAALYEIRGRRERAIGLRLGLRITERAQAANLAEIAEKHDDDMRVVAEGAWRMGRAFALGELRALSQRRVVVDRRAVMAGREGEA